MKRITSLPRITPVYHSNDISTCAYSRDFQALSSNIVSLFFDKPVTRYVWHAADRRKTILGDIHRYRARSRCLLSRRLNPGFVFARKTLDTIAKRFLVLTRGLLANNGDTRACNWGGYVIQWGYLRARDDTAIGQIRERLVKMKRQITRRHNVYSVWII